MKIVPPFLLFIIVACGLFAQPLPMNVPYRSKENKAYWKNRPPFPGYWQQDVKYNIIARLDDSANVITGSETLTYYNNSPDSLPVVYFYMYQNAFIPGSYLSMLYKANARKVKYGPNESQGLGIVVSHLKANGKPVKTELTNTILKVYLPDPVLPGDSIRFSMDFASYFDLKGSVRRRMKMFIHSGFKHYDAVHWYPRICVYDRYNGWNTDQHLNREFYGDYGTFDVSLTLPSPYIVGATGTITNRDVVLSDSLRDVLDVRNFAHRKPHDTVSRPIPNDGSSKTWKFHALNVHDFAWTADPTYRIGQYIWHGVDIITLAQEENAPGWQNAALFSANVVKIYDADFGEYAYPKLTVADARDGMEYPMMTLVGGTEPGYYFVIAHEVGHQWFFGMVGNNETYSAFLDEGFTQFLSAWSLDKLSRVYDPDYPRWRENALYLRYLQKAPDPYLPSPLNTHSDHFNSAIGQGGGYGQVYYKGGSMLYNLRYVLGDSEFLAAMQHYVAQWKFCHPYPQDFRKSIIHFTGQNLSWFFDEWYRENKIVDYGIKKVKKIGGKLQDTYSITFKRNTTGMQMPVRFEVISKNKRKSYYFIPNKPDEKDTHTQTLPVWIGWDKLNPVYKAQIQAPGGIKNVIIDPENEMADINLLNNSLKYPIKIQFDNGKYHLTDRRYYQLYYRPDIWYNAVDGIKAGLHLQGNYNQTNHFLSLTAWYNTGLLHQDGYNSHEKFSFNLSYRNLFSWNNNTADWYIQLRSLDGLRLAEVGIDKKFKDDFVFNIAAKAMMRKDTQYLIYPSQWRESAYNNTVNIGLTHPYNAWGFNGNYTFKLRSSAFFSDYQYQVVSAEWKINHAIKKLFLRARLFGEFIGGNDFFIPKESQLYLGGANPEEMMENKFVRSKAFFPISWYGFKDATGHIGYGGGLNMRGYTGNLVPYYNQFNGISEANKGKMGASLNLQMDFNHLIKFQPPVLKKYFALNPYLFYDAGFIADRFFAYYFLSPLLLDGGAGIALTIKSWGRFQEAAPLTLRFDVPFYINQATYNDPQNYAFRWLIGIDKAF